MLHGKCTYSDGPLQVEFSARGSYFDNGVSISTTQIEWDEFDIDSVSLLGVDMLIAEIPWGLKAALLNLAWEVDYEQTT